MFAIAAGDGCDVITDFGGVGRGYPTNPAAIAEVDTIKFTGAGLTADNMLLTQNGDDLEITFEGVDDTKVILQNFQLDHLDNLWLATSCGYEMLGNIIFDGEDEATDSYDVYNDDSLQAQIWNRNTVTFLNDLDNDVSGFDDSNDVINGQGGNDTLRGLSGDDVLRDQEELVGVSEARLDNAFFGGEGNDTLQAREVILAEGQAEVMTSMDGGLGDDLMTATAEAVGEAGGGTASNTINGGDGNDTITANVMAGAPIGPFGVSPQAENIVDGGTGDDAIAATAEVGGEAMGKASNTINGGDNNDTITAVADAQSFFSPEAENIIDGGTGDDEITATAAARSSDNAAASNEIRGGDGHDSIVATASAFGDEGNGIATNTVECGDGDDSVEATADAFGIAGVRAINRIDGGAGNDVLSATATSTGGFIFDDPEARSELFGGAGDDNLTVAGGDGNILDGGTGNDVLTLSDGIDTVIFALGYEEDSVFGFTKDGVAQDILQLNTDLGVGAFSELDTNGNDILDDDDDLVSIDNGSTELAFNAVDILSVDVTGLMENDFMFVT